MDAKQEQAVSASFIRERMRETVRDLCASPALEKQYPHQLAVAVYALNHATEDSEQRDCYRSGLGTCFIQFVPAEDGRSGISIAATGVQRRAELEGYDIILAREDLSKRTLDGRRTELFRVKIYLGDICRQRLNSEYAPRSSCHDIAFTGQYTEEPVILSCSSSENYSRAAHLGLPPDPERLAEHVRREIGI